MLIVIKDNSMFGGYIGFLSTEYYTPIELPSPFNVSASEYTGQDKNRIISSCKRDGNIIFGCKDYEIKDLSKY